MIPFRRIFWLCLALAFAGGWAIAAQAEPQPPQEVSEDEAAIQDKPVKKPKKSTRKSRKAARAALDPDYKFWLDSVELIMSKEELDAFLELSKDYQRDAFIERFWKARDPYPQTPTNEARERWESAVEVVVERFGNFDEDRSRVYLVNEPPDVMMTLDCHEMWPAEIWYWQKNKKIGARVGVLFYQKGAVGQYRIWYPDDGPQALARFPSANPYSVFESCSMQEQDALRVVIALVRNLGKMGFVSLLAEMLSIPKAPKGEWVQTFHAYSTEMDEGASEFPAWLEIEFPGRHQSRTVVQGVIKIPSDKVEVSDLADYGQTYNILLVGEVIRDDKLFDSFQYQYNFPIEQITNGEIPLVFDRYLRPGEYNLVLKLEDLNSIGEHREEVALEVPERDKAVPVTPSDPETARILAEANAAISSGDTTIKIVPPRGQYATGMMRIDTLTTGKDISEVVFDLDGGQHLVKNAPPWSVELDLGSLPQMRTLTVIAKDASGQEVARDVANLNSGSHRFDVRIVEPRRGQTYTRSLRAEAKIDIPEGSAVDRVEFYLNETLKATLFQPPWTLPILLNTDNELAYVRVVAYQPDGNFIEDTVWVNAPDYMENLDIQFVELFITVLDKEKHPVMGLPREAFQVFEDGRPQQLRRFEKVSNLPIHAGILLDVSASMEPNLETALKGALTFLEEVVTPKDRATIVTFNDHPNLAVKFTNDMPELASGLAGLRAERGTALYDSVIFSLYYFNGIKGQRALILLSDGRDEHSRFEWEDTLEYARRAGVSIYSIGLTLGKKGGDAKKKLVKLAEETGGRSFFIDNVDDLEEIYRIIQQELRSRYFVAYQSSNTAEDTAFRTVEVEVDQPGLEAKTLRGYYP
jgi:Ca-activated chloride channel family protein